MEALRQAIYCMLRIERFSFEIYSDDYGVELMDKFGQPLAFVQAELEETITDTLLQDDRIAAVDGFVFTRIENGLHVRFEAETVDRDRLDLEWEVTA